MKREGAVFLKLDGCAIDAARARWLLHLGKDSHVTGGVSAARFDADNHADADETPFFPFTLLFLSEFIVIYFFQETLQQPRIVAAIIDVAAHGAVGHLVGLNQVFPAYFDGT